MVYAFLHWNGNKYVGAHRGTQWYSEGMEGKEPEFVEEGQLREDRHAAVIDERRRTLVSALKSGEYPQTFNVLRREASIGFSAGFCCLGVACDVAVRDGLQLDVKVEPGGRYTYGVAGVGGDRSQTRLPEAARLWYGFESSDPYLKVPRRFVEINESVARLWAPDWICVASALNDDCKLTLPQIGECFQFTFLRDDWEAEHGADAS